MLFNVGTLSQEGFDSGYFIIFENGLVLKTESVLWLSIDEKNKIKSSLEEVVNKLELSGFELSDVIVP